MNGAALPPFPKPAPSLDCPRMQIRLHVARLVALALVALAARWSPAHAGKPLFPLQTSFQVALGGQAMTLPDVLAEHEAELRADPDNGYDWVFPMISQRTTRHILRAAQDGRFRDGEMVASWAAQFYELYAINHNAIVTGRPAEAGWARATRLARWLWKKTNDDGTEGAAEARAAALIQAIYTVYVHIVKDLPRALLMTERHLRPGVSQRFMKEEYFSISVIFGDVIEEILMVDDISPPIVRKLWPRLPGWLRHFLSHSKFGLGAYLHALRRVAWWRYKRLRRKRRYVEEVEALVRAPDLTDLLPPGGRHPPGMDLPHASRGPVTAGSARFAFLTASPRAPALGALRGPRPLITPGAFGQAQAQRPSAEDLSDLEDPEFEAAFVQALDEVRAGTAASDLRP